MTRKNTSENLVEQYKKKQVNLLPDLYFKKKKRVRLIVLGALVVAVVISFFSYQLLAMYEELDEVKMQNRVVRQSIQDKSEESKRQNLLSALKKRIEFKVNLLKEIESDNASALFITNTIEDALPSGVYYLSVDFDSEESISIYGRTSEKDEIPDLLNKLRVKNIFVDVSVESITKITSEDYTGISEYFDFTIACRFGGADNEVN